MFRTWWINNSWRFWAIRWVLCRDPYAAVEVWQEYRYMLNPTDERDLAELICDEYSKDISAALRNPVIALLWRFL